jgi:tetratricopeptide (TPR) repeat protein
MWLRRGILAVPALVLALHARSALAQTDTQRAGARAAATQGFHAFQKGQWQKAIDLFSRAQRLVRAPTQVLFIARAHAKLGHYVKARELYLQIIHEALAPNAPAAFRKAQESAAKEVKDVEAKIAHLTIQVGGAGNTTVIVTMDGNPVPPALVGIEMPVDPGKHQVKAVATGFKPATKDVTLAAAADQSISLTLEANPGAGAIEPPQADDTPEPGQSSPPPPAKSDRGAADRGGGASGLRIGAYAALGVGVVGAGLGTFFVLRSSSKRKDADAAYKACGSPCVDKNPKSAEVASLDDQARSAKTLAIVGYAVGGVGVAAGVTLFLLSQKHGAEHVDGATIHPWVGLRSAGVTGTF